MPLSTDQQAEIDQARGGAQPTLRPSSPALEEILFKALPSGSSTTWATMPPSCRRRA
jgi:hypothetical protein